MNDCPLILSSVTGLWNERLRCVPAGDNKSLVTLPMHYFDGDLLELLVKQTGVDTYLLSDFGQVASRLSALGVSIDGEVHKARVQEICKPLRVIALDYELVTDAKRDQLGAAVYEIASAMLQVDAMSALKRQGARTFVTELTDWLQSVPDLSIQKRPETVGKSGKTYKLTAAASIETGERAMIQAVSATGRGSTRSIDHAFRVFYDLTQNKYPYKSNVVVLAEPVETYPATDLAIFENCAVVADWTAKDLLKNYLLDPRRSSPLMPTTRQRLPYY